jgi:hypothetical protein
MGHTFNTRLEMVKGFIILMMMMITTTMMMMMMIIIIIIIIRADVPWKKENL